MNDTSNKPLAAVAGASTGIGYELVREFAEHGFDLLIASDSERIADAARALESYGAQVQSLQTDLATYEGVEKLYQAIQSSGRPVDSIAINTGVGVSGDFARSTDFEGELTLIQLNVVSPVQLTAEFSLLHRSPEPCRLNQKQAASRRRSRAA